MNALAFLLELQKIRNSKDDENLKIAKFLVLIAEDLDKAIENVQDKFS